MPGSSPPENAIERNGRYYNWSTASPTVDLPVTQSGTYWLNLVVPEVGTGRILCSTTDTVNVIFGSDASVDLGPDKYICGDQPVEIGGVMPDSTHKWNTGETSALISVHQPGKYTDSIYLNGCVLSGSVSIAENPFHIELGNDIDACEGQTFVLHPSLPDSTPYVWSDGSRSAAYTVDHSEQIVLQADWKECLRSDTLKAVFKPSPKVDIGRDTIVCDNIALTLDASSDPGCTYLWNNGSNTPSISPSRTGNYSVRVTSANGCYSDDTAAVEIKKLPALDLGKDLIICRGSNIKINPAVVAGDDYLWSDGLTNPERIFSVPGKYRLQARNSCGTSMDDVEVIDGGNCEIHFPNAFTPNHDGRNDLFPGTPANGVDQYVLRIYNRWGQLVYSSRDAQKGWNGDINGQPAPAGNYLWQVQYHQTVLGNMKYENGSLMLVR